MIRFHEEQRFRKATIALLLGVIAFAVFVTAAALTISRPDELIIVTITPLVVVLVALLYSRAHLDVDVNGEGVTIAFRYLWPARHISFADIVAVEMRRYRPLLDYGGWGVRFGLGMGLHDRRQCGREAALAKGHASAHRNGSSARARARDAARDRA